MSTKRRRKIGDPEPKHRYHIRLHFKREDAAARPLAVVGSTNNLDDAKNDYDNIRRLHPNADILDTVTVRTYTYLTGWHFVDPKEEPPES